MTKVVPSATDGEVVAVPKTLDPATVNRWYYLGSALRLPASGLFCGIGSPDGLTALSLKSVCFGLLL